MSARYMVISVGCLECSFEAAANPEVELLTDDLDEAIEGANRAHGSSVDLFVVDTATSEIAWARRDD